MKDKEVIESLRKDSHYWQLFTNFLIQNGFERVRVPENQASAAILKKGAFQIEFSTECWWLDNDSTPKTGIDSIEELEHQYLSETGERLQLK